MIGKAGATLLCDALKSNTTITKLNLGRPKQKKTAHNDMHQQSIL